MVDIRESETTDHFEAGKHYTGVDASLFSLNTPYRYGFMLLLDPAMPGIWNTQQVVLTLPPQSITIDEPAATLVTPTQNSGKYIERRGQVTKTITISGTTGFNYKPKLPGLVRDFLPQSMIIEQEGPNSGMGRFLQLRNLFRKYWEIFSNPANVEMRQKKPLFIFINEKDDESWIVEPMNFRMSRQTPRNKFTYQYDITMQTVALADNVSFLRDTTTLFEDIANVRNAINNVSNNLSRIANGVGNAMAAVSGAVREAVDAVTGTLNLIAGALDNIANGAQSIYDLYEYTTTGFKTVYENFFDVVENFKDTGGSDPVPDSVYADLAEAALMVGMLSGHSELYGAALPELWGSILNLYNPAYGLGGYNDTLTNPLAQSGVIEGEILPGDDLVSIATRNLGDAERFQEIIVLNNLKPPYLSPTKEGRLPNTLAPGDPIILPARRVLGSPRVAISSAVFVDPTFLGGVVSSTPLTTKLAPEKPWRENQWQGFTVEITSGTGYSQRRIIISNTADTIMIDHAWTIAPAGNSIIRHYLKRMNVDTNSKSSNDQLLGTDLQLGSTADVSATSSGDILLVSGTNNMKQAIQIKLKTAPRELTSHPSFGLSTTGTGTKMTADNLLGYKLAVRQTLLSDRRIDAVQRLKVTGQRDIVTVEGYVLLRGRSQPFAIDSRGGA